jgi:hypothetical protein
VQLPLCTGGAICAVHTGGCTDGAWVGIVKIRICAGPKRSKQRAADVSTRIHGRSTGNDARTPVLQMP